MKRDYRKRNPRTGATQRKVSKRFLKSYLVETKGENRGDEVNMITGQYNKARIIREISGVGIVYVGPSVEGDDKEYVKVLTGDVDRRKPSFA